MTSARSAHLGNQATPIVPDIAARLPPPPPVQFHYPTRIDNPITARIRQYSLEDQADASGLWSSIPESFAQLRSDLNSHNFLATLGKYAVDDPRNSTGLLSPTYAKISAPVTTWLLYMLLALAYMALAA